MWLPPMEKSRSESNSFTKSYIDGITTLNLFKDKPKHKK